MLRAHRIADVALAVEEQGRLARRAAADGEHHLVEPGQAAALPVGHPVFGIALQQGEFPEPEFLQAIRAAADDPARLRADAVSGGEDLGRHRRLQDMFGQDRHAAEEFDERGEDLRRDHLHREVVHFGHREVLAADAEQVVA